MTYFNRRNNLVKEYSGYEEVSPNLKDRLFKVITTYSGKNFGLGRSSHFVHINTFEHELKMEMNNSSWLDIYENGTYGDIFTATEIFLVLARKQAWERWQDIYKDVERAFDLSGSVYFMNDDGEINLRTTEDLAKELRITEKILSKNKSAYSKFFEAVGNLMGRKDTQENIVKDIFVAFEDYLKQKTRKTEFNQAISWLSTNGHLTNTQKSLNEKLYAYRSDVYGVTHAGNSKTPDEIDALWYLETTISQIKLINRKLEKEK